MTGSKLRGLAARLKPWSSGDRGHRIAKAWLWSLIAKVCAALNLFGSVPFVIDSLGLAGFGAWATLMAIVAFSAFLDFGLGNSVMSLVAARSAGGRDDDAVVDIWCEASKMLGKVTFAVLAVSLIALPVVDWERLLGLPPTMANECRLAICVVTISIALAVPSSLSYRVYLGRGRGDKAFQWQAAGHLGALVLVILVSQLSSSLAAVTAAAVLAPLAAAVGCSLRLLREYRAIARVPGAIDPVSRRQLRTDGWLFFGLQLSAALAFSTDLMLISAIKNSADAGAYAILQRLFAVIPLCLSLIWTPLWPVYRQALAQGDHAWVASTLARSMLLALFVSVPAAFVLAFGSGHITSLWALATAPNELLIAGFAIWCVIEALGAGLATFLNAAGVLRYQLVTACVFALLSTTLKISLLPHLDIGWIPWITIVSYVIACILPNIWFGPRIFRRIFSPNKRARYPR